jgi:hypothetical protein
VIEPSVGRVAAVRSVLSAANRPLQVRELQQELVKLGRPAELDPPKAVRASLNHLRKRAEAHRVGRDLWCSGPLPAPDQPDGPEALGVAANVDLVDAVLALLHESPEPLSPKAVTCRLVELGVEPRNPQAVRSALSGLRRTGKSRTVGRNRWIATGPSAA